MNASRQDAVMDLIRRFAADQDLELELGTRPGELVLVLPGDKKLKTVCSIILGEHDMILGAFVIRNPDENHLKVYRYLLRRNLRLPGLAYAIDATGDVYVVTRVPLAGVDETYLDRLLGVVLDAADSSFNELLALGFLTSMRKEWAWRRSRHESLRNLEAFRGLLEGSEDDEALASEFAENPSDSGAPDDAATPDSRSSPGS